MRAFRVKMPSGAGYWTVLDEELSVVPVADAFLRHLRFGRDGAESTTKAYAGAIALFLRWCSRTGRGWQAGAAQLGSFMTWLAHAGPQVSGVEAMPGAEVLAGPGSGHVRGESRINAILTAVRGLVVHAVTEGAAPGHLIRLLFEVADDVDLPEAAWGEDGSTGWRVRARHRLREPDRPVDRASDAGIVALLRACCSARDRLLVLLLARAGLRRGEALGLRRSDVHLLASSRELGCEIPRAHLHVVRRDGNPNGAVAKSRRQRVVPLDFLVVQAFDSYEFERMRVPAAMASDFVFVNLFRGTVGAPMRLDAVNDLVTAAARRAGIGALHPHQMRHAFASNVLDAGGTLDEVQDLLGHATITSTQVYAHPDPARLRTAVHAVPSPAGAGGGRGVSGAAVTARALPEPAGTGRVFEEVLAGVVLHGTAARLAGMIDPLFLAGAGWDPVRRALSFPSEHRLLGRRACRVSGCDSAAHRECPGVCWRCLTWLKGLGMTAEQIAGQRQLPPRPADEELWCAVPGCCRGKASGHSVLCSSHKQQFRRKSSGTLEEFFASPGVGPLGAYETCAVVSCSRPADRHLGYCQAHYARWRQARSAVPGLDARAWERAEPPVAASGRVSLHGLPPLVAVQVLFGLWRRTADDVKTADATLRAACRALACQRAPAIGDCDIGRVRGENVRALIRALARYVRLAMTGPDSERARDLWDLRVFGHRGRLDFTGITQPWLRESVKRWAAQDLPRHRGRGSCEVRNVVNAVTRLSESLSVRPDRGDRPATLTRRDIEDFLNRLGYLESAGTISRYQRNAICRGARTALDGIRLLGLARHGQPAAALPGDVVLTVADIPAKAEPGEPGRDLPAEIMQVLCAALDGMEPGEFRTAVQIAIDTGRRPEEIICLPLDCLTRDREGKAVLAYDNRKAARDRRRLPVSDDTAAVITAQQARVTARFADTPAGELALLPTPLRNPSGRKPVSISWLENRHREWANSLGPLRTRDGTPFDPARIVPYAYRHTYAQRHADAGVPIDVLAQLMDHKNLDQTRGYYRVGEDRRRAAVDKVTAMSFDRHGNRIWRDARAMLDDEHARYAVGSVAVPYGTCTEPSNVAAGGGACPVRFRCAGCDHFGTDVSYLPDLTAHLDDLLRTRERLAAVAGVDDWARAAAAPPQQEITRIRQLISRIQGDIAQLSDRERAVIDDAVTTIRKHRAVHLGMPAIRSRTTLQEETA